MKIPSFHHFFFFMFVIVGVCGPVKAEIFIDPYPKGTPTDMEQKSTAPIQIHKTKPKPASMFEPEPEVKAEKPPELEPHSGSFSEGVREARASQERVFWSDNPEAKRWAAAQGESMRGVLNDWSQQAGAELIWYMQDDFAVSEPVIVEDTFEVAVQSLLDQYGSKHVRPVGNLHIDPDDGKRTLVIHVVEGE